MSTLAPAAAPEREQGSRMHHSAPAARGHHRGECLDLVPGLLGRFMLNHRATAKHLLTTVSFDQGTNDNESSHRRAPITLVMSKFRLWIVKGVEIGLDRVPNVPNWFCRVKRPLRVAREASNSTLSRNCCNRNGKLLMKPEPLAALAGLALETKHKTAPDPVTQMLVSSTWVLALLCKGYSVGTPYKVHFRGSTIYTVTAPLHRPTHEIADLRLAPSREV